MAKSQRMQEPDGSKTTKSQKPLSRLNHTPHVDLDEKSLPEAVGKLFELNNYAVKYGSHVHGAEVDIIAKSKSDPFAPNFYVEVTIQYVDNTKYGKDATKFILIRELEPSATCLSVSLIGFTPDVAERAEKSRIILQTYSQLFSRFERFSPYVDFTLNDQASLALIRGYEEPLFHDKLGEHYATDWLDDWISSPSPQSKWLVILGEYGTGKTSLTLVLRHRWIEKYQANPSSPIPIRIELRRFTRQFDARSLLHYFLDSNRLSHVPIDFLLHLIRSGRVVLLLDGYDEMAQFLNARERRACLSALAELSSDGARGILTSRPNYFTETEELAVFDALYTSIEQSRYHLSQSDRAFIAEEKSVDDLIRNYVLNKHERYLRDLDQTQTESLVRRKLEGDIVGQRVILEMLNRIFRDEPNGSKHSLAGKPVIISYLLELTDDIKADTGIKPFGELTEWSVYKLVVDRLMMRDFQRSPTLNPEQRRRSLQRLAMILSGKDNAWAGEDVFFSIIDDLFKSEFRRLSPEERRTRRDDLFQDIRSSATLTRSELIASGWQFSHNSLREYLVAETLVSRALARLGGEANIPISSPMRAFVASLPSRLADEFLTAVADLWQKRSTIYVDSYISIAWDLFRRAESGLFNALRTLTGSSTEKTLTLSGISLSRVVLSDKELGVKELRMQGRALVLSESEIVSLRLCNSDFAEGIFDRVSFRDCDLSSCNFSNSVIFECEFKDVKFVGTNCRNLDENVNFAVFKDDSTLLALTGSSAIGFLKFNGAQTDEVEPYYVYQHHPKFSIAFKICENIQDQRKSQLRGLTQRGVAQSDPPFARALVDHLKSAGLIEINQNDLVSATSEGRKQLPMFIDQQILPYAIEEFLAGRP